MIQNNTLLQVLSRLSSREQQRWRQYVHSDYFNKHLLLRQLCSLLLQHAPDFSSPALERQALFAALYGQAAAYDARRLNNLISAACRNTAVRPTCIF